MKLTMSLLLGAAAGIVGVAAAQAADLPSRTKGPAVEYVRICDGYGTGFFYIPGTETCLKVHGYVRAEYTMWNVNKTLTPAGVMTSARAQDNNVFFARGVVREDTRTSTSYGVLRSFASLQVDNGGAVSAKTDSSSSVTLDKAYIQFAGITAGRAQSQFDFYADALGLFSLRDSDRTTNLLAYTAVFGGGFSATLSFEDRNARAYVPVNLLGGTFSYLPSVVTSGQRMPDVVAMVNLTQGWGQVQLSGALHQVTTQNGTTPASLGRNSTGYAVQAGVEINLPMLAAGDQLWIEGAYASGALDYIGANYLPNGGGLTNITGRGLIRTDGDVVAVKAFGGYALEKEKGYSVMAALLHNWSPTLSSVVTASYMAITPGAKAKGTDWTLGGLGNYKEIRVSVGTTWAPVSGFSIGVEGMYARVTQSLGRVAGFAPTPMPIGYKKDYDSFIGRLRINRAF